MINNIRVGIPILNWLGGVSYVELLVRAVTLLQDNERPKLFLVVRDDTLDVLELYKYIVPLFDGIFFVGKDLSRARALLNTEFIHCHSDDELYKYIDFYFPVNSDVLSHRYAAASWIPDFQHKYLPDFFSAQEIANREHKFRQIASEARLIVFSSNSVLRDFQYFYPESDAATKVMSFFSYPQAEWYPGNCIQVQEKYGLPDNFIICCNQFWAHKNYERLLEAVAILYREGTDVHLVCTGSKVDYRYPGYYEKIEQLVQNLGISVRVHVLGMIPRFDQIQLIRRSLFSVQPSLFEGWSIVVEDCRVLGKTILLSDLDVNFEQNPDHGIYFKRTDVTDLALKLNTILQTAKPGPDLECENEAQGKAIKLVHRYAEQFCNIVRSAKLLWPTMGKDNVSI
jgi:glycosyltransferase involved in cell wall biosynthesis